jgi:hypothetical protein
MKVVNKPWLKKTERKTVEVMGAKINIRKLSFGDSRKAIQGAIKYNPVTKQTEIDQTLAGLLRTIKMIESWDLTDENDNPLPITVETLDKLDEEFVSELIQVLGEEDDNEVTEAEKKL